MLGHERLNDCTACDGYMYKVQSCLDAGCAVVDLDPAWGRGIRAARHSAHFVPCEVCNTFGEVPRPRMALFGIQTEFEDELLAEELEEQYIIDNWQRTQPKLLHLVMQLLTFFSERSNRLRKIVFETGRLEAYASPAWEREPYVVLL